MAKKKKSDQKVTLVRNGILGFMGLLALSALVYVLYVGTGLDEGEIVEGEDYTLIENARPRREGDPIEVIEFFSYACIHCKNIEPLVEDWLEDKPDDVVFTRQPTTFSAAFVLLAQTYFTLEQTGALEANHNRIFRAIHDARTQFASPESVADYIDGRGVSREEFLRVFNSPQVRQAMRAANRDQQRYVVAATPSFAVAGKYMVGMRGGQRRALEVVDHLIAQERGPQQ